MGVTIVSGDSILKLHGLNARGIDFLHLLIFMTNMQNYAINLKNFKNYSLIFGKFAKKINAKFYSVTLLSYKPVFALNRFSRFDRFLPARLNCGSTTENQAKNIPEQHFDQINLKLN